MLFTKRGVSKGWKKEEREEEEKEVSALLDSVLLSGAASRGGEGTGKRRMDIYGRGGV